MMGRKSLIAACVMATALGTANMAVAGAPIGGITVKGGCNYVPGLPCPRKGQKFDSVTVRLDGDKGETWTYDAAKGTIEGPMALVPAVVRLQRAASAPPIPGVGVVVKKNPGGGASMVVPVGEGGNAQLPKLEDGIYDIVIRVPNDAFATKPRNGGRQGIELTFTIAKRGNSITHLVKAGSERGSGSPKQAGF